MRRALGDRSLDAVVIVRGGGPVNDLAWLNDYALARWVCLMPIPLHTGIGHKRDCTILVERKLDFSCCRSIQHTR